MPHRLLLAAPTKEGSLYAAPRVASRKKTANPQGWGAAVVGWPTYTRLYAVRLSNYPTLL